MSSDATPSKSWAPPHVDAFLEAPDRLSTYEAPTAEILKQRAHTLLTERLGAAAPSIQSAFARGVVGVQSDQTHYSDGFALLMPLQQGIAVAVRHAEHGPSRVVFAADEPCWTFDRTAGPSSHAERPAWVKVVERLTRLHAGDRALDCAVVSMVPAVCRDGYMAALAVATVQALWALEGKTSFEDAEGMQNELMPTLRDIVATATARPYSIAYPIAAYIGRSRAFILVDTATREHLPVETAARDVLSWAVLDPGTAPPRALDFHRRRRAEAEEALAVLRDEGFSQLKAFRDLEHRDLQRALDALPEPLQPVARHLVTENRRVQKHVAAMRRSDWQMIGALLLMAHASLREHWRSTHAPADFLVAEAETMTLDGIYGACMTERDGCVLVVGRPPAFAAGLERLVTAFEAEYRRPLRLLRP